MDWFFYFPAEGPIVTFCFRLPVFKALATTLVATLPAIAQDESLSRRDLVTEVRPSVMTIRVEGRDGQQLGMGAGFVIDANGLIATNSHVITEGRPFTVETSDGRSLPVIAVEASNISRDLALVRVNVEGDPLPELTFADDDSTGQGMRVMAFGNPLGLENSVVEGVVSAKRMIDGREMLQMAMPIAPGNSGGPLVDLQGRVHGIVNMKSAIDDNLGFAIPAKELIDLREHPNPVAIDRWVRLGGIDAKRWSPRFGSTWQRRGSRITVSGRGAGFGGRSLLLSKRKVPSVPFEIGAMVRLDDESGAAGLIFHGDGNHRHYGFYPSGGRLRLSCFLGPNVFSWQVLHEVDSEHYLPGQWNHLKVRVTEDQIECFVNGHSVIKSSDRQLTGGRVGVAKFRATDAGFKRFELAKRIEVATLDEAAKQSLSLLEVGSLPIDAIGNDQIRQLGASGEQASRELVRRAMSLEEQARRLRQLASDVRRAETIAHLQSLHEVPEKERLLRGALLIATLDNPDLEIDSYREQIDAMADEISDSIDEPATPQRTRQALHTYLFQENGFHGSRSEYYHPANSHLNRVIDDREGLPITLSILYMELGRRLGIEIDGVGLPGHFVVSHVVSEDEQQLIDVFERGKPLSHADAAGMVALHAGRALRESDLRPNTTKEILTRVLNNLIGIASRDNDIEAMLRYSDAMVAINPDESEYRLLRAQLRGSTGRARGAIEDLDQLLDDAPPGLNRSAAMRLRDALRSQSETN